MKFTCRTKHFLRAALLAERFAGKNLTLPVLSSILVGATSRGIRIAATNLEHAIQVSAPGDVAREGRAAIPAKSLSSFLQSLTEEKVGVEEKQGSLVLKTAFHETRIRGMNADEFPLIPKIKKERSFFVPGVLLQKGIESVISAVSLSEFKPALSGVFFKSAGNMLTLAATDVFRLAEKSIALAPDKTHDPCSFILPHRVAHEIRRVLGEDVEETLEVIVGDGQVLFEGGSYSIFSRAIDGVFPDYQGILPREFQTSIFLKRDDLLGAVRGSAIFASKLQDVTLEFSKEKLNILSSNPDVGEYRRETSISSSGKDAKMSFNYKYLLDGASALHEEEMFFGVAKDKAVLRNKSDNSFLYMLAPIHIS